MMSKNLSISEEELAVLETKINELKPLLYDIKVQFSIVKRRQTTAKRGEYCLLMYSDDCRGGKAERNVDRGAQTAQRSAHNNHRGEPGGLGDEPPPGAF